MLADFVSGSSVQILVRLPRKLYWNFCCTNRFAFPGMSDDVGLSQTGPNRSGLDCWGLRVLNFTFVCFAQNGGGFYQTDGAFTCNDCTFLSNVAVSFSFDASFKFQRCPFNSPFPSLVNQTFLDVGKVREKILHLCFSKNQCRYAVSSMRSGKCACVVYHEAQHWFSLNICTKVDWCRARILEYCLLCRLVLPNAKL